MGFFSNVPEWYICQSAFRPDRPVPETYYWESRTLEISNVGSGEVHLLVNAESSGGEDIICTWFQMSDDKELRKLYWQLYPGGGAGGIFCLQMAEDYRDLYIDPINVCLSLHLPNEHGTVMMPRQAFFQLLHKWLVKYNEEYLWGHSDAFFPRRLNYSLIPGLSEDSRAKLALYAPLSTDDCIACAGLDPSDVETLSEWWEREQTLHPDDYTAMEKEWDPEQSIPRSDYWEHDILSRKNKYLAWIADGVSLTVYNHSHETHESENTTQSDSALDHFDASEYGCLHNLYQRLTAMLQKPQKATLLEKALGLLPWKDHKPQKENMDPLDMKIPTPIIDDRYRKHHQELTVRLEAETAVFCYESFRNGETLIGEPITVDERYDEQILPADAALELTASLLVQHNLQKIKPQKMVFFPEQLDYSQIPGLSCRAAFEKLRPVNTLDALSHPELIRNEVYLVSDWIREHYPKSFPWQTEEQPVYQPRNDWKSFDPYQYVWISKSENGVINSYWAVGDDEAYEDGLIGEWYFSEYVRFTVCGNTVFFSKPAKFSVLTRWFRLQEEKALIALWWRLWEYENGLSDCRIWHENVSCRENSKNVVAHIQYDKNTKEVAVGITCDDQTLWNTLPMQPFMEVLSAFLVTRKLFGVPDPSKWEDVNPEPDENILFPQELDYAAIPGLSEEAASRFERWRPKSYWDALCIPGHACADILTVRDWLKQKQ